MTDLLHQIRVWVVLDEIRHTVYGVTADDAESLRFLAELQAKYPDRNPNLTAMRYCSLVAVPGVALALRIANELAEIEPLDTSDPEDSDTGRIRAEGHNGLLFHLRAVGVGDDTPEAPK